MRTSSLFFAAAFGMALGASACSKANSQEFRQAAILTDGGNAAAGARAIRKYGCIGCHTVSGVPGARGLVAPPLDGIADRSTLAGELANTPPNMMRWIQHPREVEPHTLMPEMNVTEDDSRDIAAYLYTLHADQSFLNSF
jgi:cytochrome c2